MLFFARRDVGLLSLDLLTGLWRHHDDLFDDIIACCEIDGRLFLTAANVNAWSGIDLTGPLEGSLTKNRIFRSFITSTETGAGISVLIHHRSK